MNDQRWLSLLNDPGVNNIHQRLFLIEDLDINLDKAEALLLAYYICVLNLTIQQILILQSGNTNDDPRFNLQQKLLRISLETHYTLEQKIKNAGMTKDSALRDPVGYLKRQGEMILSQIEG